MREYGHSINVFMSTHDSQAKIDHIIHSYYFDPDKDLCSFTTGRDLNDSRCGQPERHVGKGVNWLQRYSLGNGDQYEKPTVSSVYMGWMADWVQVEEWDLAASRRTPLSSTAIHFHYNTPFKPAAHNHTWNLIRGGGILLFTSDINQNFQPCPHYAHNTFQGVKVWLFDLC